MTAYASETENPNEEVLTNEQAEAFANEPMAAEENLQVQAEGDETGDSLGMMSSGEEHFWTDYPGWGTFTEDEEELVIEAGDTRASASENFRVVPLNGDGRLGQVRGDNPMYGELLCEYEDSSIQSEVIFSTENEVGYVQALSGSITFPVLNPDPSTAFR